MDAIGSGYGPLAGSRERISEPSGPIKGDELLQQWSDCHLFKGNHFMKLAYFKLFMELFEMEM